MHAHYKASETLQGFVYKALHNQPGMKKTPRKRRFCTAPCHNTPRPTAKIPAPPCRATPGGVRPCPAKPKRKAFTNLEQRIARQGTQSLVTQTCAKPWPVLAILLKAPALKSRMRLPCQGPRSVTVTRTLLPLTGFRTKIFEPSGNDR